MMMPIGIIVVVVVVVIKRSSSRLRSYSFVGCGFEEARDVRRSAARRALHLRESVFRCVGDSLGGMPLIGEG